MSPPRGGDSWKWSDTENQSKPLASANFHSLRISSSGPPMWPMWIPNFMSRSCGGGQTAWAAVYQARRSMGSASARKGGRPMDFEVTYSEEQQRFRAEVRAWLTEHVEPDITRRPTSPQDNYRRYQQLRALGRELGAK